MPVTREQALAELARRELARRGKSVEEPSVKPKEYLPLIPKVLQNPMGPLGRGVEAAQAGVKIKDVPGLIAEAASGFFGDAPERVAQRPIKSAAAGLFGIARGTSPERKQLPFPRPVTRSGAALGKELEFYGGAAGAGEAISSVMPLVKSGMKFLKLKNVGGPTGAIKKAEDELIKILQPQVKKLDTASKKGLESPDAITKSIPFVKPAKTHEEFAGNFGKSKKSVIKARNEIIRGDNYRINDDFLLPLQDDIDALRRLPQTDDVVQEISEMEKVFNVYKKFNAERGYNRIQAQAEKVRLQRKTEPLLKKLAAGENIQRSPAEIKALDKIRYGLMKMVEGGDPEVKRLNEAFAALKETEGLARHQANLARKATPNLLEKTPIIKDLIQILARNRAYPEQVALRALNVEPSIGKRTKDISKLFELAQEASQKPSVMPKSAQRQIVAGGRPPLIPGPQPRKGLPVTSGQGEGFERLSPNEATSRIKRYAAPILDAISGQRKALPPPSNLGEGFERVPKEDALRRLQEFAFKYFKPQGKEIETISDAVIKGQKKITPKSMGLNPFTGREPGKAKTALQAALKRLKRSG